MTASSPQQAVANGRAVKKYDQGMCQKYVRDPCWRVGSLYGSAIEAWNGARYKHAGDRNPPAGAPTYYSGGQYGHAVISVGGGRIRSTDCTTSGNVNDADLSWPEKNWGYKYLGWTQDINGVLVIPNKGSDDMPLSNDDLSAIAKRVNQVLGDFNTQGEQRDPSNKDPEQANRRLNEIETVVRDIQARVKKLGG
jgi:hypothetical protein